MENAYDTVRQADSLAFEADSASANSLLGQRSVRMDPSRMRGRGTGINPSGRYEPVSRHIFDDGWNTLDELPPFKTEVMREQPRKVISRNDSPDLPFDQSVNPYRGCEHGCVYCFARPTHAYMGLSAGLDFETKLFAKPDAPSLLRKELAAKGYVPKPIALGSNTDPYQPIEKRWRVTRQILEVLEETNHPLGIVTKSALVTRDIDILSRMARKGLARVAISVTTLDRRLSRAMEPRAATPSLRLDAIRQLSEAGIPVSIMAAPIIPVLNDHEIEPILEVGAAHGAVDAGFGILRLPLEVSGLFKEWLLRHYPDRYTHILSVLRSMRGGKDYDAQWGTRLRGEGPYAAQLLRRFEIATRKFGLASMRSPLRTNLFSPPRNDAESETQLSLF